MTTAKWILRTHKTKLFDKKADALEVAKNYRDTLCNRYRYSNHNHTDIAFQNIFIAYSLFKKYFRLRWFQ